MTARTSKWLMLSALCLLSLDLTLAAVAAPRAPGLLERARTSALARAGAATLRGLEGPGRRAVGNLGARLLAHVTQRGTGVYAFIVRATPGSALDGRRGTRLLMIETRCIRSVTADGPSGPAAAMCPLTRCPLPGCPKQAPSRGTTSGAPETGLPISLLGVTLE